MRFTEKGRAAIRERAQGRCDMCGLPAPNAQIHHRRPRGMGGSKDLAARTPANGALLHAHCHNKIEMNRRWALENGWLVPQGFSPDEIPVNTWRGWAVFTSDGLQIDLVPDVDGSLDLNGIKNVLQPVVSGVLTGESQDSPLADA